MSEDDEASQTIAPCQESAEDLINYTQGIRKAVVEDIVGNGVPEDDKKQKLLLSALSDMDHTSLQRVKLDIDRQGMENDRQAQEIALRLHQMQKGGMRHEKPVGNGPPPAQLPVIEPVEGETVVGMVTETSKTFLQRMDGDAGDDEES